MKKIKVIELFAGVGGFRIGLEGDPNKKPKKKTPYKVVWSNQWEPSTKRQHANEVYVNNWGEDNHSGEDIFEVIKNDFKSIPDHDLLVGGFPCQDYSVATTLKLSGGLQGKKGVLWWAIEAILRKKKTKKPKYLLLENVDRLLKSPSSERGRDFAIMLKSLDALGYAVEWRVINAAEYGMPQRRRRVFIIGYHKTTDIYKELKSATANDWISKLGLFAKAFKINKILTELVPTKLEGKVEDISRNYNLTIKSKSPFENAGMMINSKFWTVKTVPNYSGKETTLGDVLQDSKDVDKSFYVDSESLEKWKYQKGAKKLPKVAANGHKYFFSEGGMIFPDSLERASRTIITGEGGTSPSRFKHVIKQGHKLRRLTPVELERLNMFPDNHTKLEGITDAKRAFFMGNALVVGVIEKLGDELKKRM